MRCLLQKESPKIVEAIMSMTVLHTDISSICFLSPARKPSIWNKCSNAVNVRVLHKYGELLDDVLDTEEEDAVNVPPTAVPEYVVASISTSIVEDEVDAEDEGGGVGVGDASFMVHEGGYPLCLTSFMVHDGGYPFSLASFWALQSSSHLLQQSVSSDVSGF